MEGESQFYVPPQTAAKPLKSKSADESTHWNLYGLKGLRAEAKAKVMAADKLPEDVKRFIVSEIDLLPDTCTAVKVDAFGQAAEHRGHVQAKEGEELPPANVTRNCHVSVIGLVL